MILLVAAALQVSAVDYARVRSIVPDSAPDPWVSGERCAGSGVCAEPVEIRTGFNSAFPWGQNDGPMWQGKGLSLQLSAGAGFRRGGLEVVVSPKLVYAANGSFALAPLAPPPGYSPFAYPYHRNGAELRIDWPQRFGTGSYRRLDPGETRIRFRWRALEAGAGTNSMSWGPGIRNAIVMSDNAGGFPHAYAGTSRPVSIGIGKLGAQIYWGQLSESRFFDTISTNNHRWFNGLLLSFEPRGLEGLSLGAARVFYELMPDALGLADLTRVFTGVTKKGLATPGNPGGNDAADQMISLFARWALKPAGFEAYVEWARNDHNWDIRDFLLEPEHSQGYTIGFQKVNVLAGGRLLRLNGEITHLERSATLQVRATPPYYTHHVVRQGYTHHGQVIGAGIGPGGNSQYLGGDVIAPWGSAGAFVGRQVHDNDAYYGLVGDTISFGQHYVELQLGARGVLRRGRVDIGGVLALSRHMNRYYLLENDPVNLHLTLWGRWRPSR